MSADNYIGIWQGKDGKFRGYMLFASDDAPKREPKKTPLFEVKTMRHAVLIAQQEMTEYGYTFFRLKPICKCKVQRTKGTDV